MRVDIKDVHYGDNIINKIYLGSNLVFDRSTIYDSNQNVYIFDLTKVVNNKTLTLQDRNSGTITDWGDGISDTNLTHTYANQGTYIVKTRQGVNNIFGSGNSNTKNSLIKCINIDNSVTDCFNMFYGCTSLTTAPTISNSVTDCANMFYGCTSLTTIPQANIDLMEAVKNWTNTTCTSYSKCYYNCTNITTPQTYATLSGLYPNWFTS